MPFARSLLVAVAVALAVGCLAAATTAAQEPPPAQLPTPIEPPPDATPEPPVHQRLWFAAPRRARAGRTVELAVRRRGTEGRYVARLCVAPPALGWSCRRIVLRDGVRRVEPRVKLAAPGRWLLEIRNGRKQRKVRRATRADGGRLRVLATGDSMIQIVDRFLADGLGGRAAVRSEAHISTGLSKPAMLDWVANARSQARRVRPDVTVVFIGANDGFPMGTRSGTAYCCDAAWTAEYSRRVAQMMRAYRRGRAGRVLWLTLPAPRSGSFREVFGPVNAAIRRAARRTRGAVVVPIDRIFTPGFVYRDTLMQGGRSVQVRQGDGVHLNTTGAAIAARRVIGRLRVERVL